ncbi:UNVERIFIED_CONTAM: hypothetical protein RMT77_012285 [Armadillidium vulgare]
MKLTYALLFILSTLARKSVGDEDAPLVQTQQGLIRGVKDVSVKGKEFYSYLGIPFAEPPVGELRFKDPVSKTPWKGVLNTTKTPDYCYQLFLYDIANENPLESKPFGKEDCLYLNIYTSKPNRVDASLPVMVFIHGGAFVGGGSSYYGGKALLDEEVVLVIIQYRVGVFGFLSTEDAVVPGNMGLKDQQLALKWVKENIRAFGGDPESVTLLGNSAGGASVQFHMFSPGSKGLFHKAILQSGTSLCPWVMGKNHRKFALETGKSFGCSIEDGKEKFLKCLQKIDAEKLVEKASTTSEWGLNPLYDLPNVDGDFLPDSPEVLIREKKYHKVNVMAGKTKDEGAFLTIMLHRNPKMVDVLKKNFPKYGPLSIYLDGYPDSVEMANRVFTYYLKGKKLESVTSDDENLLQLFSDNFFGFCHDTVIHELAKDDDISLYLYQMDHFVQYSLFDRFPGFDRKNIVGHTDDLVYLFTDGKLFKEPPNREDSEFQKHIVSFWTNFAKTGNPTPHGSLINWKKVDLDKGLEQLILIPDPEMRKYDFEEERKLWRSLKTDSNVLLGIYEEESYLKTEL